MYTTSFLLDGVTTVQVQAEEPNQLGLREVRANLSPEWPIIGVLRQVSPDKIQIAAKRGKPFTGSFKTLWQPCSRLLAAYVYNEAELPLMENAA
jgi:hypothetical protein